MDQPVASGAGGGQQGHPCPRAPALGAAWTTTSSKGSSLSKVARLGDTQDIAPSPLCQGLGTRPRGSGVTGSGLPELTELLSGFLRRVWGIPGPVVPDPSRSQQHLASQLLDRKRQQHTNIETQSNPAHKTLQVDVKGRRKSEGVCGFHPTDTQAAGTTLCLRERTNWPALSAEAGLAAQPR